MPRSALVSAAARQLRCLRAQARTTGLRSDGLPSVLRRRVTGAQLAALRPNAYVAEALGQTATEDGDAKPAPNGFAAATLPTNGHNGEYDDDVDPNAFGGLLDELRSDGDLRAHQRRAPESEPFPWTLYDRACAACIDSPLDQLLLIRQQFVNLDGSRPARATDQHWSFLPNARLREELREMRRNFVHKHFPLPTYEQKLHKQKHLEQKAYDDALVRYNKLNEGFISRGQIEHHSRLQQQMRKWHKPVTLAIKQEQADIHRNLPSIDRNSYGPYLTLLDADILAVITLHEVLSAVVSTGERGGLFSRTALAIGKQVFMEVRAKHREDERKLWIEQRNVDKIERDVDKLRRRGGDADAEEKRLSARIDRVARRAVELDARREFARVEQWDSPTRVKLGGCLIGLMIGNCMIKDREGRVKFAVEHDYVHNIDKTVLGVLRAQDAVLELLKSDTRVSSFVNTRQLPMIVPPRPWTDPDTGGYFDYPSFFMRVRHSLEHKEKLREVARHGALDEVFKGLNALGNVRWRVNDRMFDVINAMWEFGGGEAGLIEREMEEEAPYPTFEGREWLAPLTKEKQDKKDKIEMIWRSMLRKTFKENRERHSLNCDTQLKLQVAKDFLHMPFYFPHNLDFRGRAYPIPPHLQHLGNDMCRGLLSFDEGKALGVQGLYWLKLQIANLWGHDKLSNDGRVAFVADNLDMVIAAAKDPFVNRWWLETDSPFQLLAACQDLSDALKLPDPTQHVSYIAVHQDGSCNGLQHYAALARDVKGAKQVNLLPSDKPQDVYIGVANLLEERVRADLASEDDDVREMAELCVDRITRKLVKQTVMTSVYGVTFIGARDQIHRRLDEQGGCPDDKVFAMSCYLARYTIECVGDSFSGARQTMEYLAKCASVIGAAGEQVKWVTPLNLPIMQPYKRNPARKAIQTVLQSVVIATNNDHQPFHKARQRTAFAPNFVHSLDASHMLLTAVRPLSLSHQPTQFAMRCRLASESSALLKTGRRNNYAS